jgi:hypothetical protein
MGVVYRAYDSQLASDVALKSLSRVSADDQYHLKREFRALADIRHPNLIDLYELFADGRTCFFTMELVVGEDLLKYLRGDVAARAVDPHRFRDAARQLALALSAVHAAKRLHRDVKPSNVMVTHAGRLILLDFGLTVALSADGAKAEESTFAGTRGYMAPEQLRGEALTPAIDWYGLGATLFEAATGRLPFDNPLRALAPREPAPRVRAHVTDFPEDLDRLIGELLNPTAGHRPDGPDILRRLGVGPAATATSGYPAPASMRTKAFEGREGELNSLRSALEEACQGKTVVVHVRGPSGIGKSELARRFVERVAQSGAAVLRGRCHPQESVAFNALDGAIDDLSRLLESMPYGDALALVPPHCDALSRIFPVLERAEPIAESSVSAGASVGAEAFRRGVRALKQLLFSLAERQPLILWIDDAQWGDEGSGTIIRELLGPPDSPPMLLLLTYRSEDKEVSPTLQAIGAVGARTALTSVDVPLRPLSEQETLVLIGRLLADGGVVAAEQVTRLARETNGSPFFIQELARYVSAAPSPDDSIPSHVRLGDLLQARMRPLSEAARNILEVVSVAGGPLEQQVLLRASGAGDPMRRTLATLERECLVRTVAIEAERRTEVYHHRVRDEVLATLTEETRRSHHRAIADAMLTAERPKLARVVDHYEAAGDLAAVRRYVVAAAKHAGDALAFDLAARLYRRAIEIGGTDLDETELHARLGDALANAGRDWVAAEEFERAAELAEGQSASLSRVPYLRQRAAMEYLQSGHRKDAARVLDRVMAPMGLKLPTTRDKALRRTMVNRAALLVRGLGFEHRSPAAVPQHVLDRLDLLHVLHRTMALVDHTSGAWVSSRLLLEALEVGEVTRLIRALASECVTWAAIPGALAQRQVDRMLGLIERLGTDTDLPYDRAGLLLCRGVVMWFRGRFVEACNDLNQARDMFQTIREAVAFNIASCEGFRLPALAQLGHIRQLADDLEAALQDAEDRGDEFFVSSCAAGEPSIAWLARDLPSTALRWAERVLHAAPAGYYSSQHYFHVVTCVQVELYERKPAEACRRIEEAWPLLKRNYFLSVSWVRDELACLRARAAIAVAGAIMTGQPSPKDGYGVDRWLRLALREAREIERHGLPFGRPLADLLRAGASAVRGRNGEAIASLRGAALGFRAIDMSLHHHVALFCARAVSQDGVDARGARLGEEWMRKEGIVHPARLASVIAPGFSCL